ncbi:MAG: propionyl-CoA synthetase, partial [Actinomycetota bacterium]
MAHAGELAANAGEVAHARSLADPAGFWGEAAALIDWVSPPERVLDDSAAPLYRWFVGGQLNTCANALDRHVAAGRGDRIALIHDSAYTGEVTRLTYAELLERVSL